MGGYGLTIQHHLDYIIHIIIYLPIGLYHINYHQQRITGGAINLFIIHPPNGGL